MIDHTYWVSIGRNVGASPMSEDAWRAFRHGVDDAVVRVAGRYVTSVRGSSTWAGAAEETYLLLATIPAENVAELRRILARLATAHDQDAIGFVGGPGTDATIDCT